MLRPMAPAVRGGQRRGFTCAGVIVNQHISRRRRKSFHLVDLDASHDPASPDGADDVATNLTLRAALARLPVRQRVVVVLTYYEDLPDAQIAEALGCGVNTVKSHRAKALQNLRRSRGRSDNP